MTLKFQVTFDCHDIEAITRFWAVALEYEPQPPPDGFASWAEFATANNFPREQWRGALIDPDGDGPRLFFQPVPEDKTAKNRVHLDINVAGRGESEEDGRRLAVEHAHRCEAAGGRMLGIVDEDFGWHVAMRDVEGNEFCIQ